ncbi:hypothetical protein D9757_005339 [Collybiopsis confluens]|uniref:Imidazole glycerol phosphate synthase hisHF n=1 Tax=Collybiopsis confluens TaxID=2823264 RepID=A0A8H5HLC9_9AGAR|nr:hypothetical protein D9757_005339 [Collybiopsis confluens]
MGLYLLDYGAGNVQSLANSLSKLGHSFTWISAPEDFHKATSLIFPGVGAFGTAIEYLTRKGLLEPLREYIQSGKPYFGICIGMQVLFQSSSESPGFNGLGIVPAVIDRFDDSDKSVPHIGWNSAELVQTLNVESSYYYFVHSYCAKCSPNDQTDFAKWTYTATQYGQELFVSSVRRGNIFGTQFHPEKSGSAGLALIDDWLKKPEIEKSKQASQTQSAHLVKSKDNLTKRIIACMDVRTDDGGNLVVTKGDQYDVREKVSSSSPVQVQTGGAVRNLGKPVDLAFKYYAAGADEICLLNITSFRQSPLQDQPMIAVVRAAAERVFVPLTIGGGIKDTIDPDGTKHSALDVASEYFRAGADKVSIGSDAVYAAEKLLGSGRSRGDGKSSIEMIALAYGNQAVVVSIDPRRIFVDASTYDGPHKDELVHGLTESRDEGKSWWYACTVSGGRETRSISACQLARAVEALGAGEILVNSIDRDGTGQGFDLDLLRLIKGNVKIPVVASSGAGKAEHFLEVFQETGVEAALAAGIFHREEVEIREVKEFLKSKDTKVRTSI